MYFKLRDRDRYVPGEVLATNETKTVIFVVVEAQLATVAGSLLGDNPVVFTLAGSLYLGNWVSNKYRNTWRTTLDNVPIGKGVPSRNRPLTPTDVPVDLQLPSIPKKADSDEGDTTFMAFSSGAEGTAPITSIEKDHWKGYEIRKPSPSVLYEEPRFVNLPNVELTARLSIMLGNRQTLWRFPTARSTLA